MGDVVFHPYWSNDTHAEPGCIRVSYWRKPEAGDILVAAGNWSDSDRDASIHLPPHLRGLRCEDAETGETLSVSHVLNLRIPHHDVRVVRLRR